MCFKNGCVGWQMPVSCFDCQCNILSDPFLDVLQGVDWSLFLFLERYKGKGRHPVHSRIGLLRALLYMRLAGIPSVHELLRVLERDPYKMNNLGLDRLPDDSMFSRFKRELGGRIDRMVSLLTGKLCELNPSMFVRLGADSTKIEARKKDGQAGWGYDHIDKRYYKGYKVHLLYETGLLVPVSFEVTSASVHDNKVLRRLTGKLGAGVLKAAGLFVDRAYDSRANVEDYAQAGVTVINRKNKRKMKRLKRKYRLQDYCQVHGNRLNHLYKNRMDCEVTNSFLKQRLGLKEKKTKGRIRTKVEAGLSIMTRQIQVLRQLRRGEDPRTTILN
jgi:transposase, IS5 family